MNALFKLVQGSAAWHEHRAKYRNASETAAVMGASPWMTPHELWLIKTGRKVVEETAPMRHGSQMEPAARAAFEEATGLIMQPQVVVDGMYSASLDGIVLNGASYVHIGEDGSGNLAGNFIGANSNGVGLMNGAGGIGDGIDVVAAGGSVGSRYNTIRGNTIEHNGR